MVRVQLARLPARDQRLNQSRMVFEMPVKTAARYLQAFGQGQYPHAVKAMLDGGAKCGVQPVVPTQAGGECFVASIWAGLFTKCGVAGQVFASVPKSAGLSPQAHRLALEKAAGWAA